MQPNLKQLKTPYVRYPIYNIRQPSIIDMSLDKLIEQKIREAQYTQQQQAVEMRTPTVLTDPLLNLRVRDYYRQKYDRTLGAEIAGRAAGAVEGAALGAGIGSFLASIIGTTLTIVGAIEPTPLGEVAAAGFWAGVGSTALASSKLGATIGAGVGATIGAVTADYSTWYATKDMISSLWTSNTVGESVLSTLNFVGRSMDLLGPAALVKSTVLSMITDNDLDELLANAYGLGDKGQVDVDFSQIREALNVDIGGVGNFIFDMFGELITDPGNWKNVVNLVGNVSHIGRTPFLNAKLKNIKKAVMDSTEKVFTATNDKLAKAFYKAIEAEDTAKMLQILEATKSPYLKDVPVTEIMDTLKKYAQKINKSAYKTVGSKIYAMTEAFDAFDDFMTARLFEISSPIIAGIRGAKTLFKFPFIRDNAKFDSIKEFFKGNNTKYNEIKAERNAHTVESFRRFFYGEKYAEHTKFKEYLLDIEKDPSFDIEKEIINKYKIRDVDTLLDKLEADPNNIDLLNFKERYAKYLNNKYQEALKTYKQLEEDYLTLEKEILELKKSNPLMSEDELKLVNKDLFDRYAKAATAYFQNKIKKIDVYKTNLDYLQNPHYKELKMLRKELNNLYRIKRMATQKGTLNIKSLEETLQKEFNESVYNIMKYSTSENEALQELTMSFLNSIGYNLKTFIKDNVPKAVREQIEMFYNTKANKYYEYVIKSSPTFMKSFVKNMIDQTERLFKQGKISLEDYTAINKYQIGRKTLKDIVDSLDEIQLNSLFNTLKKLVEEKEFTSFLKEDIHYAHVKIKSKTDKMFYKLRMWESVMEDFGLGKLNLEDTSIKTSKDIWNKLPKYNFKITDQQVKVETLNFLEKVFKMFNNIIDPEMEETLVETVETIKKLDPTSTAYDDYFDFMSNIYFITPEGSRILRLNSLMYKFIEDIPNIGTDYNKLGTWLDKLDSAISRIESTRRIFKNSSNNNFARYNKIYSLLNKYKTILEDASFTKLQNKADIYKKDLLAIYNELQSLSSLDIVEFKSSTERLTDSLDKAVKRLNNFIENAKHSRKKDLTEIEELQNKIKFIEEFQQTLGNTKQSFEPIFEYYKGSKGINITPEHVIKYTVFEGNNNLLNRLAFSIDQLEDNNIGLSNTINDIKRKIRDMLSLGKEYDPDKYNILSKLYDDLWTSSKMPIQEQLTKMHNLLSDFYDLNIKIDDLKSKGFLFDIKIHFDNETQTFKIQDKLSNYDPLNKLLHSLFSAKDNVSIDKSVDDFIESITKTPEELKLFEQTDLNNYNIVDNIIKDKEATAAKMAAYLKEHLHIIDLDRKFIDLYSNGNKTSAIIRKSSKYNSYINTLTDEQKYLTNQPLVLFDVETTGSTSNGVYSITYSIYNNEQWEKHVYFTKMQPDWKIDSDVDNLNGGVGSTIKKIMEAKDAEQIFNTPQEMFEAVKNNINENSILIAHNARFDYSQIMNSLSGNKLFDKNGQVSNDALEAFAKDNFDFTFIDSQKLLSLFFATGQNLNKLTNVDVLKQLPDFKVAYSFTDRLGRTTYTINGEVVSAEDFLKVKEDSFLMEYDAKSNITKTSYKGGDIHEAATDIAVMETWTKVLFDNLKDLKIELKDIDESTLYYNKLMNIHLDSIRAGEINDFNYEQYVDNILKNISIDEDDFVGRNLPYYMNELKEAKDYNEFFRILDSLEEFLQSNEDALDIEVSVRKTIPINKTNLEVVTESMSLKDYLQEFIDELNSLDDVYSQKIKVFKQAYNGALVGQFQYNELYVATSLANQLKYSTDIEWFKAMFFNDELSKSALETNELILAEEINKRSDLFLEVRKELTNIENNINWYIKFMDNLEPKYYDIYLNIKRSLAQQKVNPENAEIFRVKLHREIISKCKEDNLSVISAFELLNEIESNLDTFELPSAKTINKLYNTIRSGFTDALQDVKYKYIGNPQKEYVALTKDIDNMVYRIEQLFAGLRQPLSEAKQMNRFYKHNPLTLAELNEISLIDESFFKNLDTPETKDAFKYIYEDLEDKFENGVHRLLPHEAIKYNSKVTFNYYKDIRSGMSLKRLINKIENDNFVKEESKLYKALPIVDFEHSRLAQLYTLAANTGGFDIQDFIYSAKNGYALSITERMPNTKANSMYNALWDELLSGNEDLFKQLGLDPILFQKFVGELESINETTFSYLKNVNITKQRLKNALMYNLYFKNSDILRKESITNYTDGISRIAMRNYIYAEQLQKMNQFETSSFTFKDAIEAFTDENGTLRVDQFQKYFREHPEMTLVVFDDTGKYKQLNVENPEVINQFIANKNSLPFSIMSVDSFKQLTKNQTYDLPAPLQWVQKYVLGTIKRLGLALSFPFMIKNAVTASYMTLATIEDKFNIFKYIKHLSSTIKDYKHYTHIYSKLITSATLNDFAHSYYDKEKNWVSLLNNSKFMEKLKIEDELLYNYISKLSPKEIERLIEYNDIVHTAAAYGQINEITRYHEREKQYEYNAKKAEEQLKDTSNLSEEEIANLKYQVGIRKYQNMDIEEIKKEYAKLENKKILTYQEQQTMNLLKIIIDRHSNKFYNDFQKYISMIGLLNINNNIETVLRATAIRSYLEDGMTFDQATMKTIETQFTYDNKSIAEQLAEFAIPFVSYPIRMGLLMTDLIKDGTLMDVLFWANHYLWDEEEENVDNSAYLTRRRAQGDIPINNKLLSIGNPIKESLFMLKEPGYSLNNKLNPLFKPAVDYISGSEYVRWNHLPVVSQTSNVINLLSTGKSSMINDYYRYNQYPNYYLPRINNRIGGTIYNKLYTRGGYSRVSMNMSNLTNNNLKHRVNAILKYSGPTNVRK